MIRLTGTIFQKDDIFVTRCNELGIETYGRSFDEAWKRTPNMIRSHFKACAQLGTLGDLLKRFGISQPPDPSAIRVQYSVEQEIAI